MLELHRSFVARGRRLACAGNLAAGMLMVAAGEASGQGFAGVWEPTLGTGPCTDVYSSTMFDFDGSGAVPVIGTGGTTPRVLALRGGEWIPVGEPLAPLWEVSAFAAFDPDGDGPQPLQLIAAGHFLTGSIPRVARWDGTTWQAMGTGLNDAVYALAVFDPDGAGPQPAQLIAGGKFTRRGDNNGPALNGLARWEGTSWQPVGGGVTSAGPTEVHALEVFDADGDGAQPEQLIVGGSFTSAGGTTVSNIAAWNGSTWSALGAGVGGASAVNFSGIVSALRSDDADGAGPQPARLLAGGYFTTAGDIPAGGIAQWDGTSWQAMENSDRFYVHAINRYDPDGDGPVSSRLVIGKSAQGAASRTPGCVAVWDGTSWQPLGEDNPSGAYGEVRTLTVDTSTHGPSHPLLVAGGYFKTAGGAWSPDLARWDGATWQRIAGALSGQPLVSLVQFDIDGAGPGGDALLALGRTIFHWNGADWLPYSAAFPASFSASALGVFDTGSDGAPALLMTGTLYNADGDPAGGATYQSSPPEWEPFGPANFSFTKSLMIDADGVNPEPASLVVTNGRAVFRWTGASWLQLGGLTNNTNASISALSSFDPDGSGPVPPQLVVAGSFTSIGGVALNRVARWDGVAWQPLGNGLGGNVGTLATYDPDGEGPLPAWLIAGGSFTALGGTGGAAASRLARWDGSAWLEFGGGAGGTVSSLRSFDFDGAGPRPPELFAAGTFTSIGGVTAARVARWDGVRWRSVGDGVESATSLHFYTPPHEQQPRLVIGGSAVAGRFAVPYIAMLSPFTSPADVGSGGGAAGPDGALNNNDFIAFINLFFANDANADIGRAGGLPGADGLFDNNDFIAFISFFFAG